MSDQDTIYQAVVARGYRDGLTAEQFVARQIAKLQEELAEASEKFVFFPYGLEVVIQSAGRDAREYFDDTEEWKDGIGIFDPDKLKEEFADCMVVLMSASAAIAEATGKDFDIVAEAIKKATKDVKRGVRNA